MLLIRTCTTKEVAVQQRRKLSFLTEILAEVIRLTSFACFPQAA